VCKTGARFNCALDTFSFYLDKTSTIFTHSIFPINCTSLTMTVVCLQKTRDTYLLISDIDLGMYVLSGAIFLFSFLGEGGLI
jgi:hypothetical protein